MDLSSNKIFQYLGCTLVILIVIYIVMSLFNYQLTLVETLTNMSSDSVDTAATIKESTTKTLDTLLVDKYRSNASNRCCRHFDILLLRCSFHRYDCHAAARLGVKG